MLERNTTVLIEVIENGIIETNKEGKFYHQGMSQFMEAMLHETIKDYQELRHHHKPKEGWKFIVQLFIDVPPSENIAVNETDEKNKEVTE